MNYTERKIKSGIKYITLAELKEYYEQSKKEDWHINPNKYYHSFGKGWYSTAKKSPMDGSIFKNIDNGAVIEFKTKYGEKLIGIVKSINFDEHYNTVDMSVMSTCCGFGEDPTNYGLSITDRRIKVLEGKLPDAKKEFAELKSIINL